MIATVGPTTTWLDIMKKASEGDLNLHVKCSQTILFFTVAGSISVNSHNRNLKVARVSDTLISLTIVRPDGEIEELTPGNDLFNYVLGGYGLMGIIIEAKIQLEKNFNLDIQQNLLTDITKALTKAKENKNIELYNLSPSLVEGNNECMEIIYTKSEVQDPIEKFNYKEFENINDLKDNLGLYLKLSLTRLKIFEKIIWWVEKKWWFGLTESESVANNYPPYNVPYFKQWELMEFFIPIINTKQFIDDVKILLKKKKIVTMTQGCRIIKKPNNDIVLDYTKWTKEDWRISFVMNMWITKSDTHMREFCTELMKICEKYDSTFIYPIVCRFT